MEMADKKLEMTIEKLESYKGLVSEMDALKQQIDSLYDTYRSPQLTSDAHSMSVGGSPVETAVNKVLELKTIYEQKYEEAANLLYEIETWLSQADPEIRAIARFHYVLGYSWQRTNTAVCGYPSHWTARKKLMRYLGKEA